MRVRAQRRGCGGVAHGSLDGDDVAPCGDESAGEVVPKLVQLVGDSGVGAGRAPAVVDEVVVPRPSALVEQPPARIASRSVPADVLRQDRDDLVRGSPQVDRAARSFRSLSVVRARRRGRHVPARTDPELAVLEVPPRVVESDAPRGVVWSSPWPSRLGDQVVLELADAGSETALTFTLLVDGDMPDASKTGHIRRRINQLLFAHLPFSYAKNRIRAAVVGSGPGVGTGVESQHVAERIGVLRGRDVAAF